MKYKVGDKVRVRNDLEIDKFYGCYYFIEDMKWLRSNIVTIQEVLTNRYHIKEDNGCCGWTDEMFEDIKEDKMDKNTLQINMNNLTDEERTTLLSLVKKANKPVDKVWKPKKMELYYSLNSEGKIIQDSNTELYMDKNRYLIGNCFKTEEDAEFALERQKVITELKRYAIEHNEKEIDWNDKDQNKFNLYYSHNNKKILIDTCVFCQSTVAHFTSTEIAQAAIEAIGEDRIKKYYFEVND